MPDRLISRTLVVATGHDLSLALLDEARLLAERNSEISRGHAEAVVPEIAALLAPFGGAAVRCDTVVVEVGPGSFTGLRVGLAAAQALAIAWKAPLLGVRSTLLVAADARAAGLADRLLVLLAAPRGQIWVEGFAAGSLESLGPPAALSADEAAALQGRYPATAGTGPNVTLRLPPRAAAVAGLAPEHLGTAELLYVRADLPTAA